MQPTPRYFLVLLLLLLCVAPVHARDFTTVTHDVAVPAGTLLECTLSEPKLSSATTSVGDPFLCYPRNLQEFGQPVFPRGAYLVGHLEDAKEPGHFVGKGYLKMEIDRIGLPTTDIPLRAKVISVAGYRVDKEGKVIGHGHATRDVVEWMLPPLWPWKVLTLPAKGPRPTLKGEVRIIMRVMDDFSVPQQIAQNDPPNRFLPEKPRPDNGKGWRRFGQPAGARPAEPAPAPQAIPAASYVQTAAAENESATPNLSGPPAAPASAAAIAATDAPADSVDWPKDVTVFALGEGIVIPVQQYWRDGEVLKYVLTTGDKGSVSLDRIDWSSTARLNWQRGIRVSLHGQNVAEAKGN